MKRVAFSLALIIFGLAIFLLWFFNRKIKPIEPENILPLKELVKEVEPLPESPFLIQNKDLKLANNDLLLAKEELAKEYDIVVQEGFKSALVNQYSFDGQKYLAIILEFSAWNTCFLQLNNNYLKELFLKDNLFILPPFIFISHLPNYELNLGLVEEIASNLKARLFKKNSFSWLHKTKEISLATFEFFEAKQFAALNLVFLDNSKIQLILKSDYADNLVKQMPVRPYSIGTVAVNRLFSAKAEDTVYIRTDDELAYLLYGYSRNPNFRERLSILKALFN